MKQKITLAIEKEILMKGKLIAAQNDTSISKMLSDQLEAMITWRRQDLYERERMANPKTSTSK